MKITDEQLSAFLDAELPEAEMEIIREQLMEDESLANRLAELAMVDELVAKSYATIDAQPMPESVTQLLTEKKYTNEKPQKNAEIIAFPLWKRVQQITQKNLAIAAAFALLVGFGVTQLLPASSDNNFQQVAQLLDTTPSGVEQISQGIHIKPRLTFVNKAGDYCRQFDQVSSASATENIACRKQNHWQIVASVAMEKVQATGTYQTATGGSLLDDTIDSMASGEFLDAQQESTIINQHWKK